MELPLAVLRQKYPDGELKEFLEKEILAKQAGRDHPQAKGNQEMRLYKVFDCQKETSGLTARVDLMFFMYGLLANSDSCPNPGPLETHKA